MTLSDDVDTPITITRQWLGPSLLINGSDYTITGDTLRINQLMVARDNGSTIICLVTVIPSAGYHYVLQNSVNGSTQLTVQGEAHSLVQDIIKNNVKILLFVELSNNLFTPDIIIPGILTAGDNFNIICRLAGIVERLVGTPTVSLLFLNPPGGAPEDQSQDGSAYILPRIFNPGKTSDVGIYTCVATVFLPGRGFFVNTASEILQIQSNVTIIFH